MSSRPRLPLSALLSQVIISLSLEFERAGAGRHPLPGLELWSNLLRCVDENGVAERDLAERTRLSKRAVRSRVGLAIRQGWLGVKSGKPGTMAAMLEPTEAGQGVRRAWPGLAAEAVGAWSARADDSGALLATLRGLVARLELEHPHFPAGYGLADWRITGDNGQDWRPVLRAEGDTAGRLGLPALLSQVLVAYTMEYEVDGDCLAVDANVLRFLGRTGRPDTDLPRVLTEGMSTLVRHRFVETERDPAGGRATLVRLVERGQRAHDHYLPRLTALDRRWEQRFDLGPLRASLEDIVGRLELDLPHSPIGVFDPRSGLYLAQSKAGR